MTGREGHVALVTGAGTGIGAATARLLAERGMHVALAGRRRKLLEETARTVEAAGVTALVLSGDLADPALPKRLVEETLQALGRLDVLVNNAATIAVGPLGEFTLEQIDHHLAVNTRAPFLLTQEATPALGASGDGAIVNVSSSVGSIVKPGNGLYGMTKAALEYLTRASAYELADRRVRVNCIAPGPVETPIHEVWADDLQAAYADLSRRVPLGRMAASEEIAVWVWTLVDPETAWTTGNVIHVDGGQVLGLPPDAGG
jgi:NAD(P)-dependent dehydrogenase (short-subunit alcohol dehydrogenase family)